MAGFSVLKKARKKALAGGSKKGHDSGIKSA